MWTRLVSFLAVLALVLGAAACGRSHRSFAPQPVESDPAAIESAPGSLAPEGGDHDDDDDDDDRDDRLERARPILAPVVLTRPGRYRLARDARIGSGDAIVVRASGVHLDLGDRRLRGPGHKSGRGVVIEGAAHVTVTGGRIERFGVGVALLDSRRCRVRGVRVLGGDETADPAAGNPPQIGILLVNSSDHRVIRNRIDGVNLGLFVRGPRSHGNRIARNRVVAGRNGLLAICYNPAPGGDPAGPRDDRVRRNQLIGFDTGISASAESARNVFERNWILYQTSAYEDLNGTNVFRDNRTRRIGP